MKNKTNFLVIGALVIVVVFLGMKVMNSTSSNNGLKIEAKRLSRVSDSLKQQISSISTKNIYEQNRLRGSLDSIKSSYEREIYRITKNYIAEKKKVKELNLTQGVKLLGENIGVIDNKPAITEINGDTTVLIAKQHVKIINNVYVDNFSLKQNNFLLNSTKDSLFVLAKSNNRLLDNKNTEISMYKRLSSTDSTNILVLNKSIVEQRKTNRKRIFNTVVTSGVTGIVIGILLHLFIK